MPPKRRPRGRSRSKNDDDDDDDDDEDDEDEDFGFGGASNEAGGDEIKEETSSRRKSTRTRTPVRPFGVARPKDPPSKSRKKNRRLKDEDEELSIEEDGFGEETANASEEIESVGEEEESPKPRRNSPKKGTKQEKQKTKKQPTVKIEAEESEEEKEAHGSSKRESSEKSNTPKKQKRGKPKKDVEDEDSVFEEGEHMEEAIDPSEKESSDEDEFEPEKRGRKKSKVSPHKKQKAPTRAKKSLKCPHCSRSFHASKGFNYHIENFVCRPDERPGGPVQKGKRKAPPEGSAKNTKQFKRLRGDLKDRVCPRCDRVFTSTLGLQYHLDKRVCEKAEIKETPYQTLQPGTKVLSPFGVVQVVKDDRQTPTADFPGNIKLLFRQYLNFKQKREFRENRARNGSVSAHLMRRKQLTALYEKGKIDSDSINAVYFQTDSRNPDGELTRRPDNAPDRPDPTKPEGSFPDRIVECVLIQDDRDRFTGHRFTGPDCATQLTKPCLPPTKNPIRLFLRRDTLTDIYSPSADLFLCDICGTAFESKAGLMHHTNQMLCLVNIPEIVVRNKERMSQIEKRAQLAFNGIGKGDTKKDPRAADKPTSGAGDDSKKSGEAGASDTEVAADGEYTLTQKAVKQKQLKFAKPTEKFKDPRVTLDGLRDELKVWQSKMIGTMYPSVFRVLGFKKAIVPKTKKKKKVLIKRIIKKKGVVVGTKMARGKSLKEAQRRVETAKPKLVPQVRPVIPKPDNKAAAATKAVSDKAAAATDEPTDEFHGVNFNDLPPIIDMRVLVAEVKVGRYPSMRVHKKDVKHEDKCNICRKGVTNRPLVKCGFCTNSFHFNCLLQKFIVKSPEPGDSVVCNSCIQYVMAMRTRAEKRRLEKMGIDNPLPILQRTQAVVEETKRVIEGKEYECVLAQGRQAADLVEMLQDAQTRFDQAIHTSKADAARRAAILNF